jgi:hypothetical protein
VDGMGCFDDVEVTDWDWAPEWRTNSYLLFYMRMVSRVVTAGDLAIAKQIREDNSIFEQIQCVFGEEFYSFMTYCKSASIHTKYFWNVFCHNSLLNKSYLDIIETHIDDGFVCVVLEHPVDLMNAFILNSNE